MGQAGREVALPAGFCNLKSMRIRQMFFAVHGQSRTISKDIHSTQDHFLPSCGNVPVGVGRLDIVKYLLLALLAILLVACVGKELHECCNARRSSHVKPL